MQILEDGVPVGPGELVDGFDRALGVVGAIKAPPAEQSRRQVGDRTLGGLRELGSRRLVLLLLEGAHAQDQAGIAVGLVELQKPFGDPRRFVDLAIGHDGVEGELGQVGIARIKPQRCPVIGCCGGGVALQIGGAGGQIVARGAGAADRHRGLRGGRGLRLRGRQ